MAEPVRIDIWSDIACPWCYIGKRKLEAGVAAFHEREPASEVAIEFHSFELAPDTPIDFDGSEIDFLVEFKGMPEEQVRQLLAHVTARPPKLDCNTTSTRSSTREPSRPTSSCTTPTRTAGSWKRRNG